MKNVCLYILLSISTVTFAQKKEKKPKKVKQKKPKYELTHENKLRLDARSYMDFEQFTEALEVLLALDTIEPNVAETKYMIGICYMHSTNSKTALPYLRYAKDNGYKTEDAYIVEQDFHDRWQSPDLDFNLGRAYHLHNEFDSAIVHYEIFEEHIPEGLRITQTEINIIDKLIEECIHGKQLIRFPVPGVIIRHLGPQINSEFPDYVPLLTADENQMIFTSRRPTTTGGQKDPNSDDYYMEDILISTKDENDHWELAEPIGRPVNSTQHESGVYISPDGHTMLIYKNDHHNRGNIFISRLEGKRWTIPVKMQQINSQSWEASACMSADNNWIFFSSTRHGGAGGLDIYWSKRVNDTTWTKPENMGPSVNSKFDEDAPFMHHDGKTLYFSSKGHFGMGGFDIFKSEFDERTQSWSRAENLGFPINSADDDIFFVFSPDRKRAYFSSHRDDSYGDKDIYMMTTGEMESAVTTISGYVKTNNGNDPLGSRITLRTADGQVIGVFKSNTHSGKYLLVLPENKTVKIDFEAAGHQKFTHTVTTTSDHVMMKKDIVMKPGS